MKRLLFLTHEQFWPLTGGCTAGNFFIMTYLARSGFVVTVSTPMYVDPSPLEKAHGLRFRTFTPYYMHRKVRMRMIRYVGYGILSLFHLLRVLAVERYDVIYVNNVVLAFPFLFLRPFLRVPVVLRLTDFLGGFLREDRTYPRFLVRLFEFYEYRVPALFDRVFVITERMKRELCSVGGLAPEKVAVTLDGVDGRVFSPDRVPADARRTVRASLGVPWDAPLVMFHGTIEPHHGESMIAEIVRKILARREDLHILLIGVGSGYARIREDLKDQPRAHALDFVAYEDIPRFIQASDVGLIPYPRNRAMDMVFTLKLLEYLSLGLRCVTFDLKSVRETFAGHDFVAFAGSLDEFVDLAVKQAGMGRCAEASEMIRQDFTWDKVAERIRLDLAGLRI